VGELPQVGFSHPFSASSHHFIKELFCGQLTMIVTMITMTMMQLAFIEVIDVISMRNSLVSTVSMPTRTIGRGAISRIFCAYLDDMFIVVALVRRMQVSTMNIVDMVVVLNRSVSAVLIVNMGMIGMNIVTHRGTFPFDTGNFCLHSQSRLHALTSWLLATARKQYLSWGECIILCQRSQNLYTKNIIQWSNNLHYFS
jgi:hypothetical protein